MRYSPIRPVVLEAVSDEPRTVGDDRDRRGVVQDGGQYRGQCAAGTDQQAQRIDSDGHGVVLLNDTYRVPTHVPDVEQAKQIIACQCAAS